MWRSKLQRSRWKVPKRMTRGAVPPLPLGRFVWPPERGKWDLCPVALALWLCAARLSAVPHGANTTCKVLEGHFICNMYLQQQLGLGNVSLQTLSFFFEAHNSVVKYNMLWGRQSPNKIQAKRKHGASKTYEVQMLSNGSCTMYRSVARHWACS